MKLVIEPARKCTILVLCDNCGGLFFYFFADEDILVLHYHSCRTCTDTHLEQDPQMLLPLQGKGSSSGVPRVEQSVYTFRNDAWCQGYLVYIAKGIHSNIVLFLFISSCSSRKVSKINGGHFLYLQSSIKALILP